jgi:hypothetical protein
MVVTTNDFFELHATAPTSGQRERAEGHSLPAIIILEALLPLREAGGF